VIWNRKQVEDFAKTVLAPLEKDEVYLMLLAARKKYWPELPRSEEVLKREIVRRNDPLYFYQKVVRLFPQPTAYIEYNTGKPIPLEAMVIYVVVNPKSCVKAFTKFKKEVDDWMYELAVSEKPDFERFRRLDLKLFSAIHRSTSRHLYWLVDMDKHDIDLLKSVARRIGDENIVWVSATRGGFHLIVRKTEETGKLLFTEIAEIPDVEVKKEAMTPVPGTEQGGYSVWGAPSAEAVVCEYMWKYMLRVRK